ncbi:stress enhanced protein 1, chloroplastic isoform X1 [Primulina tabacum]|uniref:stress enhanced protein 1, chloroplastic isoform X1 n=1 Tax=Primulina tabacum TaxID=48773 RepID=UPI003F5AB39A
MAAATQISSPLRCYASIRDGGGMIPAQTLAFSRVPRKIVTVFATGCPLLIQKPFYQRFTAQNSKSVSIRCEQNTKEGNGLDIWIGRLAMVGFTAAISIEIATGKGLLEISGLPWLCGLYFGTSSIIYTPCKAFLMMYLVGREDAHGLSSS